MPSGAQKAGLAGLCCGFMVAAAAEAEPAKKPFDASAFARMNCEDGVQALNQGMRDGYLDAYILAGRLFDLGGCVKKDPVRAAHIYQEASALGSRAAEIALGMKFARGDGVAQHYATAGAWFAGRGHATTPLTKEDYSKGYACAVLRTATRQVVWPREAFETAAEADLKMTVTALRAAEPEVVVTSRRSRVGTTGSNIPRDQGPLFADAFRRAVADALKALPAPDPALLVDVPCVNQVSYRYTDSSRVDIVVDDALKRF